MNQDKTQTKQADEKRPVFIELAGMPGAGKTTTASLLQTTLINAGVKCVLIPEQAAPASLRSLRGDWRYAAWALSRVICRSLEEQSTGLADAVVFDRGIVDSLCWFAWLQRKGKLSKDLADIISEFALRPSWLEGQQLVCVMRATYETSLRRRHGRVGFVVNEVTFAEVGEAYDVTLRGLSMITENRVIRVIDTDQLTPAETTGLIMHWLAELSPIVSVSESPER